MNATRTTKNAGNARTARAAKLELLTRIAREYLHIETLKQQFSDCLDFHDVSVWGVQNALEAAYLAGQAAARAAK